MNPPSDFDAQHERFRRSLGIISSAFEITRVHAEDASNARIGVDATHTLRGLGDWPVELELELERVDGRWQLHWTPALFHARASATDGFVRTRAWGPRAPLLDARGDPLTVPGEVIQIGVEPRRVKDPNEVADALKTHLGVEPWRVHAALSAPGVRPDAFLALIELRREPYDAVRPVLAPVPGIVFRKRDARLTPAEGFAAHTLGRVGEVTAELLTELGQPYQVGDFVGISGLERAFERQLAGIPSGEVRLARPSGEKVLLHAFEGEPGGAIRTTLRPEVQRAAESALSDVTLPAALVALDARTGAVVAVVSRPLGEPLNRALLGRYPPGSTFKVVTAEALLASGFEPSSSVACPPSAIIGGKRFQNVGASAAAQMTLRDAMAHSCNTLFAQAAVGPLKGEPLLEAAHRFGFDASWDVGLPARGGVFPIPRDDAEWAAAAIGQGRTLATPLHMASVAAAVHDGTWRAPFVVAPAAEAPERRLSRGAARALRDMMGAVTEYGTGRVANGTSGLIGKTGTAEFGTGQPPPTHAWFIGLHGDLALAIVVEGGGSGGQVAVPIAMRFVHQLQLRN